MATLRTLRDVDDASDLPLLVITSYSIHYTKLYDPLIAVLHRGGPNAGGIAAGVGFGQTKSGPACTTGDIWHVFLFLFFTAGDEYRKNTQRTGGKTRCDTDTPPSEFFHGEHNLKATTTKATIFFRNENAEQISLA